MLKKVYTYAFDPEQVSQGDLITVLKYTKDEVYSAEYSSLEPEWKFCENTEQVINGIVDSVYDNLLELTVCNGETLDIPLERYADTFENLDNLDSSVGYLIAGVAKRL